MKRAIVYDWIDSFGGAERLLKTVFDAYPDADIYTLFTRFQNAHWAMPYRSRIRTSILAPFYAIYPSKPFFAPFMPVATERLRLDNYDEVFSITSSFVKGVKTSARHVSYVFTPTRFLWHQKEHYRLHSSLSLFIHKLKEWDLIAAKRPNNMLTLSHFSKKAIRNTYKRSATVLYPPFDNNYFRTLKKRTRRIDTPPEYFLFVGRLEPYKRVDMLIEIFKERSSVNLVIVGTGTELRVLQKAARDIPNVYFFPKVSDEELAYLYQKATATLMPQYEDFGYVALESLFFDTPVITVSESGVAEIVKTCGGGLACTRQTPQAFGGIIDIFHTLSYTINHQEIEQFDKEIFLKKLGKEI